MTRKETEMGESERRKKKRRVGELKAALPLLVAHSSSRLLYPRFWGCSLARLYFSHARR